MFGISKLIKSQIPKNHKWGDLFKIFKNLYLIYTCSLAYKYWEKLAAHEDINMSAVDLALLKQRKDTDHAESVIAGWEVSRKSTVGLLYDLLVDCGLTDLADLL